MSRRSQRRGTTPFRCYTCSEWAINKWTKVFVSGLIETLHIQFKFYCQLSKTIVSIYPEGVRKNSRHYQKEGLQRKDPCLLPRFEHFRTTDEPTGIVVHAVTGKEGHAPMDLVKELSLFINDPLVDIRVFK